MANVQILAQHAGSVCVFHTTYKPRFKSRMCTGPVHGNLTSCSTIAYLPQHCFRFAFPTEEAPHAIHNGMFVPTLMGQASDAQRHWLDRAQQYEIIGTYAQTELGHGKRPVQNRVGVSCVRIVLG